MYVCVYVCMQPFLHMQCLRLKAVNFLAKHLAINIAFLGTIVTNFVQYM